MQGLISVILRILVVIVVLSMIMLVLATIGAAPFLGCMQRYADDTGINFNSKTVTLEAKANYSCIQYDSIGNCIKSSDPSGTSKYGQWLNVGLYIVNGAELRFNVSGEVSLCQATYYDDATIKIPRVEDSSAGLPIVLDATVMKGAAKNLTEVYINDKIQVKAGQNTSLNQFSVINLGNPNSPYTADCSDGKTQYPAICGKYSFYDGAQYTTSCDVKKNVRARKGTHEYDDTVPLKNQGYTCTRTNRWGCEGLPPSYISYCYSYTCSKYTTASLTQSYSPSVVFLDSEAIDQRNQYNPGISNDTCPKLPSNIKSWFALDKIDGQNTASALTYSVSGSSGIQNKKVTILEQCSDASSCYRFEDRYMLDQQIFDAQSTGSYLQYKFYDTGQGGGYTGGYVLYLKQTKCYRKNGGYLTDSFADRGAIKYLLLDNILDPNQNTDLASSAGILSFDTNGNATNVIKADKNSSLWVMINNNSDDYKNSSGSYNLTVTQGTNSTLTNFNMWGWLNELFITKWQGIAKQVFQNLTCYGGSDKSSCSNLFNIIKALLVCYIIILGMMFSLGMLELNQVDLVIRVVKIIIVAGLINENTYNFFNNYLFDLILKASDEIMGSVMHFEGSSNNILSNLFLNVYGLMASDIFQLQLLAILGTGITGIFLFIIIMLALIFFLIAFFEFLVVYFIASLATAILLSLAPIFLVFMLFNVTRYLFDNWVKFMLRYILEPVIMFVGISALTKLFMIYIDNVLGFSVCWKCNLPFQIPFLDTFFPFAKGLNTVPIFCIYWLSPWGYDPLTYSFAINLGNIVALFIISVTAFKYCHMATQITQSILGASMGSASIAAAFEKASIKQLTGKKDE
jgi:type IV secretion system protein VirB6